MTIVWFDYYPVLNWAFSTKPAFLQAPRCSTVWYATPNF